MSYARGSSSDAAVRFARHHLVWILTHVAAPIHLARSRLAGILLLVAILLLALELGTASAQGYSGDEIKAAQLRKIVSFIRWRDRRKALPHYPLEIATLGRTNLGRLLVQTNQVSERDFRLSAVQDLAHLGRPDIVFIAGDQTERLRQILDACAAIGALTVSDTEGFGRRGVAINFYQDERRIRFEINRQALKIARLGASYQLLALARLVGTRP